MKRQRKSRVRFQAAPAEWKDPVELHDTLDH